ncbi:hypothetical protein F5050DRAFT_1803746 [Lentinula boryana]|uniref:FHA domain-containing protein n=1 Tax=Lentinula boryana TaxID=40481 RepID=A0ABQ8QR19_9AGAR|nr:hypothetical protein F5050DRAFT_1803746 [Lentinula boryana]
MNSPSPMMDNSQIGRYGTISLMKQNESNTIITAFGVDSDNLTFGRDQNCGVRLYYPDVSPIHCKITFKERKAFLVVLGTQGLLVDGCKVFPSASASSPNIIPLNNHSEIEIHGKRFRFTYPPKELRAQLFSTPTLPKKRALRLSMIESAEVFSPRPSINAMENLRVLRSPLKPYSIRSRSSSPHISTPPPRSLFPSTIPSQHTVENAGDEEEIILVEGNSPRVVEEAEDLIILEDVEVSTAVSSTSSVPDVRSSPSKSPTKLRYVPAPPPILVPPQPPMTPRRSRPTLHKAVLIRSAQRLVLAELQREEELEEQEEEAEVFGAILDEDEDEDRDAGQNEEVVEAEMEDHTDNTSPTWKESLGRIWPFRRSISPSKDLLKDEELEPPLPGQPMDVDSEDTPANDNAGNVDVVDAKDEDQTEPAAASGRLYPHLNTSLLAPPSRRLFSTPQPRRQTSTKPRFSLGPSSSTSQNHPRMSLGGGEPHRIKVEEQPWKVRDLVVPSPPSSPTRPSTNQDGIRETSRINQPSEAERRDIQERRRSALRTPDNFFPGGIPGMSPTKNVSQTPARTGRKSLAANHQDDQLDTRSLLEKMKETVEGMKAERRASSASPQKRPFHETTAGVEEFSLLRSPAKLGVRLSPTIMEDEEAEIPSAASIIVSAKTLQTPGSSDNSRSQIAHSAGDDVQMVDVAEATRCSLPAVMSSPLTRSAPKKVGRDNFIDTPSLADDEASPDVVGRKEDQESDEEQNSRKRGKVLRGTGKTLSLVASESQEVKMSFNLDTMTEVNHLCLQKSSKLPSTTMASTSSSEDTIEAHVARSQAKAPVQDEGVLPEINDEPQDAQLLKPQTTTTRSRSRSKTPRSQLNAASTSEKHDPTTTPLPLRRSTRKASVEPDAHTTDDEGSAPTKRARNAPNSRTRGQATEESDPESTSKAVSKNAPSRTTRARGKTPVPKAETDDTNDEEVTITKTKRGRRPKAAIVPEVIKEEEIDELPTNRPTPRTRKAVASSDKSHPSVASGTKGRPKKTVAPDVPQEADVNKENSHASASEDEPVVTRTRIGRPRKATTPKIKEEVTTEPENALRTGAKTRPMRTRSKT